MREAMRRRSVLVIALVLALLTSVPAYAAAPAVTVGAGPSGLAFGPDGTLYITHGESYILSALRPDGRVDQVGVGAAPLPPLVDAALQRVVVAGRADLTLTAVDLTTFRVAQQVALPAPPLATALDPQRHVVYVALQPNLLAIVDARTLAIGPVVEVGVNPTALSVDPARGRVAVVGRDSSTLHWVGADGTPQGQVFVGITSRQVVGASVSVDPASGQPVVRRRHKDSQVMTEPATLLVDANSGVAFVLNYRTGELVLVRDTEVIGRYAVGVRPRALALGDGHVYVANWGSNTLSDVAVHDGSVREVLIGYAPADLVFDATRGRLYVAEEGRNTISVVDPVALRVTSIVDVGRGPLALALEPASGRVFVANHAADTISIVQP